MRAAATTEAWPACSILVVEHPFYHRGFYQVVLDWVALNLPECIACFDQQLLDAQLAPQPQHRLMVGWLQDPVEAWSDEAWQHAMALTARCDAAGVPVINRVDRLARAGKTRGADLMRVAGLRTPRSVRITDAQAFHQDFHGLGFPLLVREDWGHGGPMLSAADSAQARSLPLEQFARPMAAELVELADPHDALYRKYRYVIAGGRGVAHHLQASRDWVTRGGNRVITDRTRQDELDYIEAPCPHHDAFMAASHALGLDFVAFDYGLDATGRPMVWEANPFPFIQFSTDRLMYRNEALHRTLAIMVAMYLDRAGLPLPPRLAQSLATSAAIQ